MSNQQHYQCKIEIVDVEDNSTVGSKTVRSANEAIEILKHDIHLWIHTYEQDKGRREQEEAMEDIRNAPDLGECDECGKLEEQLYSFVLEGKRICTNCWNSMIEMDTEAAKEEEAMIPLEYAEEYNSVVVEQQSSNKPNTETI